MKSNKKMKCAAFAALLFSALGAIVASLAFANNLCVTINWWKAFLAAGGDSAMLIEEPGGLVSWLNWSAVDYSTVTTFIPMLGFLCMTRAAAKILWGRIVDSVNLPFFKGSDQFNIALGLFGTLWGIIVIGYYKLDSVSMGDLMQCLHTALFSTLAAVVWVFLFDRPIVRPIFAALVQGLSIVTENDADLDTALEKFARRLAEASDAFDERQKCYEASFEKRRDEYSRHFEQRLADYERDFDARQKEYTEFFTRRMAELEKRALDAEKKLALVVAAISGK